MSAAGNGSATGNKVDAIVMSVVRPSGGGRREGGAKSRVGGVGLRRDFYTFTLILARIPK